MKKKLLEKWKRRVLKLKALNAAVLAILLSCGVVFLNGDLDILQFRVVPVVGLVAFASWRVLQEDLADYKIGDLNLILLIVGGGLLKYLGSGVGFYPIQALVAFLIGWGMFQAFEGDIGGGDVRLLTVAALFLNLIQLLAGISLAAAAGLLIGQRLRLRKVPFGALLIVALWLSFGVVRF